MLKLRFIVFLSGLVSVQLATGAAAQTVDPGDIVVTDQGIRTVTKVDPISGAQTALVTPGVIQARGVAFGPNSELYIGATAGPSGSGIYRWDPGAASLLTSIASGFPIFNPIDMISDGEDLLVTDNGSDSVYSVHVGSGSFGLVTLITAVGALGSSPDSIALESSGDILAVNLFCDPCLVRIDRGTGMVTTVSNDPQLVNAPGVVVSESGKIFVLTTNNGIFEIGSTSSSSGRQFLQS